MRLSRKLAAGCFLAALLAAFQPALAGGIDDFKLTRAIPADVFIAVHGRSHSGQEWLHKQTARVWKALEDAHLERDIKKMLKGLAEQNEPGGGEKFEEHWRQVSDLIAGVEWSTLGDRETAFCMKLEFPTPQWVVMLVPPADKIKEDFDGLSAILQAIANLAPENLSLAKDDKGDTSVHKLGFTNVPFPIAFTLARTKDTILVGFGAGMTEQVFAMLGGQSGATLSATPRFKQALAKLPPPADAFTFFDASRLFTQIRAVMDTAVKQSGGGAPGAPAEEEPAVKIIGKVLDAFDICDYIAGVATTSGMKTTSEGVVVLRDNAKSSPLYPVFFGNGTIKDPLKYIPQAAGDVSVWSGVDLSALYDAVVKFVSDNIPEGKEHIAQLEQMQETEGIRIKQDFLSWIQGGMTMFSVPGKTSYSPSEWVFALNVRDEAKAREMLNRGLELLTPILAGQNGSISEAQIEGAEGFKSIIHPMIGTMLKIPRPTVGVTQGRLMLGSTPRIIEISLGVAAGKEPGFAKSERFLKEGIPPQGDVTSLSFTDRSRLGEDLSQMVAMVPMIRMVPGISEVFTQQPIFGAIVDIAPRLSPAFKKLDFLLSSASVSTFDGKVVTIKSVSNYREPPAPKAAAETPAGSPEQK